MIGEEGGEGWDSEKSESRATCVFVFLRFLFGYFFVFYLVAFLFDLHWRFVHVKRMGVHRNADKDTGETKEPTVSWYLEYIGISTSNGNKKGFWTAKKATRTKQKY